MLHRYILLATIITFLFSLNAMYNKENNSPLANGVNFHSVCGNPEGYVFRGHYQNKLSFDSPLADGGRLVVTKVVRGDHEGDIEAKVYPSNSTAYALPLSVALWCFNLLSKRFYQQSSNIVEKA